MKLLNTVLITSIFTLATTLSSALALEPHYLVSYGGPDTPGRIYDPVSDATTFTYTVIGQGAAADDYANLRLKAFKVEVAVCEPPLEVTGFTPDLPENDKPPFFAGPNPDLIDGAVDPSALNFYGLLWKGWHGEDDLPILLNVDEQRTFSISFAGNIEVGPITTGTAIISNQTGEFAPTLHAVPGGTCDTVCENRQTFSFNDLVAGSILTDEYAGLGLEVSATNANVNQLDEVGVFNTSTPISTELDLGTPNSFYGGSGEPALNAATGTGVGNFVDQENALIIPHCDGDTCGAGTGTITFSFNSPAQVVSLSLIDIQAEGTTIAGKKGANIIFTEAVPAIGNNSLQTVALTQHGVLVDELVVTLAEPGAVDDLVVCLDVPTPTPTPTPTATPPACEEKSITEQQFKLDNNARLQNDNIKRLANKLRKISKNKRQRRLARRSVKEAQAVYLKSWTAIWSMSSVYTECANANQLCVTSNDYAVKTNEYLTNSQEFISLAQKLARRLNRVRGSANKRDAKLRQSVIDLDKESRFEAARIPAETVNCPEV